MKTLPAMTPELLKIWEEGAMNKRAFSPSKEGKKKKKKKKRKVPAGG